MNRPPPCPTLFPYTTLFRSQPDVPVGRLEKIDDLGQLALGLIDPGNIIKRHANPLGIDPPGLRTTEVPQAAQTPGTTLDRKSTRLNSSHPSISYAVFCLKKK